MPKFLIAIISGALTFVIGFMLGSIFTVPQNKEMEDLINAKTALTEQISTLEFEAKQLNAKNIDMGKLNRDLKERLLRAYEINEKTKTD